MNERENWQEMLKIEPRLARVLQRATEGRSVRESERWRYYGRAKSEARNLVGWGAEREELKTSAHYETFCNVALKAVGLTAYAD